MSTVSELKKKALKKAGLNDIQLLEGEQTILGQIKARNKALFSCLQPNIDNVMPSILEAWTQEHVAVLRELYARAKRKRIALQPFAPAQDKKLPREAFATGGRKIQVTIIFETTRLEATNKLNEFLATKTVEDIYRLSESPSANYFTIFIYYYSN